MAYGELGKRNSQDIDLLISPKYIGIAKVILNDNGFYYIIKNKYDKVLTISEYSGIRVPPIRNGIPTKRRMIPTSFLHAIRRNVLSVRK